MKHPTQEQLLNAAVKLDDAYPAVAAWLVRMAEQQAVPNAVLVEGFGRVALGKLNDLREKGYAINGVSIATISPDGKTEHGAVTTGGMVLWWPQQQAAEPVGTVESAVPGTGGFHVRLADGAAMPTVGATLYTQAPAQQPPMDEIKWPKARDVGRYGDMSPHAHLRIGLDSDNDVYVHVWGDDGGASVEFCTGGGGGGSSPATRAALIALMCAMEADNAARPDKDWWARRNGIAGSKT